MSYIDDFWKALKKKENQTDSIRVTSPYSGGSVRTSSLSSGSNDDIAPVRQSSGSDDFTSDFFEELERLEEEERKKEAERRKQEFTKSIGWDKSDSREQTSPGTSAGLNYHFDTSDPNIAMPKASTKDERTWFKGSQPFDDGYDFGDVTKAILGTATDLSEELGEGVMEMGENAVDAVAYIAGLVGDKPLVGGGVSQAIRMFNTQDEISDFIQKDLYDSEKIIKSAGAFAPWLLNVMGTDTENSSVLGEKSESLANSAGQFAGQMGLQAVGVPWFVTSGVTSFGSEAENALKQGATYEEAGLSAAITAGSEILTEKLFGGSGLGEKGLINTSGLTKGISDKLVKTMADFGIDLASEGGEEVVSQFASNLGSALYKEENLKEILFSEEAIDSYIESFVGGMAISGGANSVKVSRSIKTGTDYRTGLTANEQSVVDKEVKDRIAEREKDGNKLTRSEKAAIEQAVMNDLGKGYISTDTIEEVLGGETYKSYNDTVTREDALKQEYEELGNLKESDMTAIQKKRFNELDQQLAEMQETDTRSQLKTKLSEEVSGMVQGSRLSESYAERARRGKAFEADLSQYDEKQRVIVQSAIDSGILNNTRRTHELVDMVAKLSADKGVLFDFTNNAKLKESGFAIGGKTVNGFIKDGKITINVQSSKYINSVVGHEITHVLEGTALYNELQKAVFQYAQTKGDYQGRLDTLTKLYKDIEGADINAELTADLVGDYLFTDSDFINRLSTQNRNVFQKIYDEIKYLYKVATAGSKEARQLEQVKKAFENAYKQTAKPKVKNSLEVSEAVEETADLLAMHNISSAQLTDAIKRDGLLMPSVAVTNKGFSDFGEITLIFDKKTIDPNADANNKLYGSDAWTPQQNELKKNAKFNTSETANVVNGIREQIGADYATDLFNVTPEQFSDTIAKADGNIYDAYAHDVGMQTAYAMEAGIISQIPTKNGRVDTAALQAQLNAELDTDQGWRNYRKWLRNISDTIITSYDTATNEDILSNMKAQPASAKTFKLSVNGDLVVPAAEYSSIDTMRQNKNRLSQDAATATKAVASDLLTFANEVGQDTNATTETVVSAINQAFADRYSTADIVKSFAQNGITINEQTAAELQSLYKAAVELPTQYFEAKPQRTVNLDEVAAVVVPNNTDAALKQDLINRGYKVVEYDPNVEGSRQQAVSSFEEYKFSLSEVKQDIDALPAEDREIVHDARIRATFPVSVATMTDSRISKAYYDYSYGNTATTKGYLAYINPMDFLSLTTGNVNEFLQNNTNRLNEGVSEDWGTENDIQKSGILYLKIDENGNVVGHEGRHRMAALYREGVETAAVIIETPRVENAKPIKLRKLYGQDFGSSRSYSQVYLHRLLPITKQYERINRYIFGEVSEKNRYANPNIRYSLSDSNGRQLSNEQVVAYAENQIKNTDNTKPTTDPDIRYSLSEKVVANGSDLLYNTDRGEDYVRTDEFRNLQAESQRMSAEEIQLYWAGNKQIDEGLRGRFSRSVNQIFVESGNNGNSNAKGLLRLTAKNNNFNIYEGVNPSVFHDVFDMARKHLKYGELVDLHTVETTEDGIGYNDCYNYLSEDGLSGFSITPDGDLISVFNASGKSGFLRAIAQVVRGKAKTLDCYASENQNLMAIYSSIFGFKTASVMDYNMEYDHDNIAENHDHPKIAFMVNTESNVETKAFTEDQYDEALEYRNSFLDQATGKADNPDIHRSLSDPGDTPTRYGNYAVSGKDIALETEPEAVEQPMPEEIAPAEDAAPVQETAQETAVPVQEDILPDDYAPMAEDEADFQDRLSSLDDADAPPEMERTYDEAADVTPLTQKIVKDIAKELRNKLALSNKQMAEVHNLIREYGASEFPSREQLYQEIKNRFGTYTENYQDDVIKDAKAMLRSYRINVSDSIKGEIPDYGQLMRSNFGKVRFSKEGVPVDVAYLDLSAQFPHLFPEDVSNPTDELLRIIDVANMDATQEYSFAMDSESIWDATDAIAKGIKEYQQQQKEKSADRFTRESFDNLMRNADEYAPAAEEDIAPVAVGNSAVQESTATEVAPAIETPSETVNADQPIKTVKERLAAKLENFQTELANNQKLRNESKVDFDNEIARLQAEYDAKKNKNTIAANDILRRIERVQRVKNNVDTDYAKRINDLQDRVSKANEELRTGESTAEQGAMRRELHTRILEGIKSKFSENGFDFDEVLKNAKDLSTFATVDNTPQRVMEKALGYKEGQVLSDITVNQVAQNETEGIKWLNSFTDKKSGLLAQISKQYNIKPGSKESAAAQMYAEGFYVDKANNIIQYGDSELAQDFPDATVRNNIKGLARDTRIRQIYDDTLAAINESRARNAYPEIQKLDNYFLHFRAMDDTFSRLGLPFNPNDIRAKDLPTDLNGVTADLKPGQPYFSSAMHRQGKRTSFDLLGGLEKYLTSAKDQIYHIDDIQTLRALRNYIADTYGQAKGLEDLDLLTEEEVQEKIEKVYGSHLSTFAKFLNEEANVIAGKTALIDRGLEGIIGRRGITFLNSVNRQVGANMVGYNISSSMTNFIAAAQGFAKTNKSDFVKGFAQTVSNRIKSITGNGDGFAEQSPVMIRRKGADRFHRTAWQKMSDPGYALMGAVDSISTELIARTKYNELTKKGMDSQQAHIETDKWVSRLMGDRSLGQQPQLYNSKMLGLLTKFQLEVRNQLDSQFYDTIQEAKVSNEEIENKLRRNAKTAAKVTATFAQLAVAQHLFGKAFESVAGYNPAFDIVSVLATLCGFDDEEESEDTALDNVEQAFFELMGDMPYVSTLTGGRIPISSALPIEELFNGEDQYGNEKSRWETLAEAAPYYLLPGGYGQARKTYQGLSMFDEDHPVAGSYTDSGNLRFPVEDTLGNRVQAGLFGQWSSENARDYFDNERKPLEEKQIQEYIDVDIPIRDYWEYREGLSGLDSMEEKAAYIDSLDLPTDKKNLLINNLLDRKEPIDMQNYGNYSSFAEFDFAEKNPEKYDFFTKNGISYNDYATADEDMKRTYTWAYDNPEKYNFLKDNGVSLEDYSGFSDDAKDAYTWAYNNPEKHTLSKAVASDVVTYRQYTSELYDIKADKDENGKSISGSRKEKVIDYINNLDADYGEKIILFKSEYPADDTYNYEIVDYLNSRDDISYSEMVTILKELGFTVDSAGNVYWD